MLRATNGSIGLLEKWLWACKTYASAKERSIDIDVLRMWAPSVDEQRVIAEDISRGKKALERYPSLSRKVVQVDRYCAPEPPTIDVTAGPEAIEKTRKPSRKPFERAPKRTVMSDLELYVDD